MPSSYDPRTTPKERVDNRLISARHKELADYINGEGPPPGQEVARDFSQMMFDLKEERARRKHLEAAYAKFAETIEREYQGGIAMSLSRSDWEHFAEAFHPDPLRKLRSAGSSSVQTGSAKGTLLGGDFVQENRETFKQEEMPLARPTREVVNEEHEDGPDPDIGYEVELHVVGKEGGFHVPIPGDQRKFLLRNGSRGKITGSNPITGAKYVKFPNVETSILIPASFLIYKPKVADPAKEL